LGLDRERWELNRALDRQADSRELAERGDQQAVVGLERAMSGTSRLLSKCPSSGSAGTR